MTAGDFRLDGLEPADGRTVEDWSEQCSTPLAEVPEYRLDAKALRTDVVLSRTAALPLTASADPTAPATPVNPPQSLGRSL